MKYRAVDYTTKQAIYTTFKPKPGYYFWWMHLDDLEQLKIPRDNLKIDNSEYYRVYVGIATSIAARLYWHICESKDERKHPEKKVKSKPPVISTLRQSLCGLLKVPLNQTHELNELIDRMRFQVVYEEIAEAKRHEEALLADQAEFFPLNIQGNKNTSLRWFSGPKQLLSKLRKNSRELALR